MVKEEEIDISEKIDEGWVHIRFSIEIQGNDKGHIEKSLDKMAEAVSKKKFVMIIDKNLDATSEISPGWFSNFIELEALIKGFDGLMEVATQFSPTTVEILAPKNVTIPANELQNAMIDISSLISTFAHAAYIARKQLRQIQPKGPAATEAPEGPDEPKEPKAPKAPKAQKKPKKPESGKKRKKKKG